MRIAKRKSRAKANATSSKVKCKGDDQPDTETSNVELQMTNVSMKEPEAIVLDEEEKLEDEVMEMDVKGAEGGSHHEEHKQDTSEAHIVEAETPNVGVIDTSKFKGNEGNTEDLRNEVCAGNDMNVDCRENSGEVGNEEKEMLNVEHDEEEFTALEDMQNEEAASVCEQGVDEVSVVSENDFKEECVEKILPNEDLGKAKELCIEPPADAITINQKEESINNDANIANEVVLVPKKKVLKVKKIVKKKKLVKGRVAVAKDENKPQSSEMDKPFVEVRTNENAKNEENADAKPRDKVNNSSIVRMEEKNAQQNTDKVAVRNDSNPKQSEKTKLAGKEKEASENEHVDGMKEEPKSESRVKKVINQIRRKDDKVKTDEVAAEDRDKAEPSGKSDSSSKVETMGMIFMCSSKTKEDCYRFKIFGLPANKKDVVLKIYKGMRLFLFDFQLKLLYGIYKAAGPGGYNIEPDAFQSNFPSQVRFSTVHDCLPLPEKEFKKVIKDNYYTKNKFNCELNSEQVENLCKLFLVESKGTKSKSKAKAKAKAVIERARVRALPIVEREKKRRERVENDADQGRKKRRTEVDVVRDNRRRRLIDDARGSRAKGVARCLQAKDDARRSSARRLRAEDDVRHSRAKSDARRLRAEDEARRLQAKDDARRLRAEEDARRLRAEDDARRLRAEDDARRLRAEDDARRLRAEDDARRLRAEVDARPLRAEDDARRFRAEDDGRRSPRRYPRHADVYEREAYVPSALPLSPHLGALPPAELPAYTSSYTYGRTSMLDDYRRDLAIEHQDRGLTYSRPQYLHHEYECLDPYFLYREPVVYRGLGYETSIRRDYYSPIPSRDENLPSTSRTFRYEDLRSPYRWY